MTDKRETARDVFSDIGNSFNILMGAKMGKLDTPLEVETSAGGEDEAECLGTVRHMAEFIEDAGYAVDIDELGATEPLPSQDARFSYRLTITE